MREVVGSKRTRQLPGYRLLTEVCFPGDGHRSCPSVSIEIKLDFWTNVSPRIRKGDLRAKSRLPCIHLATWRLRMLMGK